MRCRVFAVLVVAAGPAVAAAGPPSPTVTARVASVDALLDVLPYLGELGDQGETARQAVSYVRGVADPDKGIDGFDLGRPVGLYGVVTADVADSYAVLVLPVADPAAVLALLADKLELKPEKAADGSYGLAVPQLPTPVHLRFAHKSAYVTVRSAAPLAADALISPADLFAAADADALAAVRFRFDRLPKAVRDLVVGQVELQAARRAKGGGADAGRPLAKLALATAVDAVARLFDDGKELAARLAVDPAADELAAELAVTPKPGTPLADGLAAAGKATGTAAAVAADGTAFAAGLRLTLPEAVRDRLAPVVDEVIAGEVAKADKAERKVARMVLSAFAPTLKSGDVDLGLAGVPAADGKFHLVAAARVADGTGIDTVARQLAPFAPDGEVDVTVDAAKVGDLAVHKVETDDPKQKRAFGTATAWVGISDDRLVLSFEPAPGLLKAAAGRSPAAVPVAVAELALPRLAGFDQQLTADDHKDICDKVFGGPPGRGVDTVRLAVTGGHALTARATLKGKAVRYAVLADRAKKGK